MLTKLCPLAALNVVEVVAVLSQVFRVGGVEGETVAASLEFSDTVVTLPVLVARDMVGVEAEVIGTFEGLLSDRCKQNIKLENYEVQTTKKQMNNTCYDIESFGQIAKSRALEQIGIPNLVTPWTVSKSNMYNA